MADMGGIEPGGGRVPGDMRQVRLDAQGRDLLDSSLLITRF